jgi:hypothetical protein
VGWYLPPVFKNGPPASPPQTIISLPVQTAEWKIRGSGAVVVLVGLQQFVITKVTEDSCWPRSFPVRRCRRKSIVGVVDDDGYRFVIE